MWLQNQNAKLSCQINVFSSAGMFKRRQTLKLEIPPYSIFVIPGVHIGQKVGVLIIFHCAFMTVSWKLFHLWTQVGAVNYLNKQSLGGVCL